MSHLTSRGAYRSLAERLNRFPQGAPPSELLFAILQAAVHRARGSAGGAASHPAVHRRDRRAPWKVSSAEAQRTLDALADRAILVDLESEDGRRSYVLPPPMAGFFEFSMMRLRGDIDQHLLAELFYQYINVEEDFIRALFLDGETQLGRVFVNERQLPAELSLHVLDYERASEVVRSASCIGVGLCYCRHKMQHVGRACDAPLEICMTFNSTAELAGPPRRRAPGRGGRVPGPAGAGTRARGLVQFGENVREKVNFICNCCGCCCEALIAARRFGFLHPVHTTNYLAGGRRERAATAAASAWMPARSRRWRSCRPTTRRKLRRQDRPPGRRAVPGLRRVRRGVRAAGAFSCVRGPPASSRRSTRCTRPC